MKKDQNLPLDKTELRRCAEARIEQRATAQNPLPLSVDEALRLIHELQVHQVELELQSQALQETCQQLEQSLQRYTDLYDFAAVGYATLASNGAIQEINLAGAAFLGQERACLIGRRLGLFISADTCPMFNAFVDKMQAGVTRESCEVALALNGAPPPLSTA